MASAPGGVVVSLGSLHFLGCEFSNENPILVAMLTKNPKNPKIGCQNASRSITFEGDKQSKNGDRPGP